MHQHNDQGRVGPPAHGRTMLSNQARRHQHARKVEVGARRQPGDARQAHHPARLEGVHQAARAHTKASGRHVSKAVWCPRGAFPHHRAQAPAGRSGTPGISAGGCLLEFTPSRSLLWVNKSKHANGLCVIHAGAQSKHSMLCWLQRGPGGARLSPSPPTGCQAVPLKATSSSLGPRLLLFGTRPATA